MSCASHPIPRVVAWGERKGGTGCFKAVNAHLHLAIERGSDPIRGSVELPGEEPRSFSGWIELVEVIEQARIGSDRCAGGPRTDTVNCCVRTQLDPLRSTGGG